MADRRSCWKRPPFGLIGARQSVKPQDRAEALCHLTAQRWHKAPALSSLYFARMNTKRFRVRAGDRTPLDREATDFTNGFDSKEDARTHLTERLERLETLQSKLYGQKRHALLVILQGMDTSGKDSAIAHVFRGFNPAGTKVWSFKRPSPEEVGHDFLWRAVRVLPARGDVAVFNRSYYEEVVVVRVHPELLDAACLPEERKIGRAHV